MKRILAITTAALMTSALAGTAAYANDMKKDESTQTQSGATDSMNSDTGSMNSDTGSAANVDTDTTASTNAAPTADDLMSALQGGDAAASSIKSMSNVSNVSIVNTDELAQADMTEIDSAVEQNQSQIDQLHQAIDGNDALKSKLQEQDVDVSNVIAAKTNADGSLTLFVQNKS